MIKTVPETTTQRMGVLRNYPATPVSGYKSKLQHTVRDIIVQKKKWS